MEAKAVQDQMKRKIVEHSIQILREHGKSDAEIRAMMRKNFHIEEIVLDALMEQTR